MAFIMLLGRRNWSVAPLNQGDLPCSHLCASSGNKLEPVCSLGGSTDGQVLAPQSYLVGAPPFRCCDLTGRLQYNRWSIYIIL